jgi:hypothetical protein
MSHKQPPRTHSISAGRRPGRSIRWLQPESQPPAARQSLSDQELLAPVNKGLEALFLLIYKYARALALRALFMWLYAN